MPLKPKAEVLAVYPNALCVGVNIRNGFGRLWTVWTDERGERLASSFTAAGAWHRAAAKVRRDNAPSDAELSAMM